MQNAASDPFGPASADMPLISVVMANFRGAAHLKAAMRAVLAQSHAHLELLVADDASDDDSVAIAQSIAQQDARVRVLPSQTNQGPGATRNRGLEAARGDWIAIVDSDDLIHPDRLSRLLSAAHHHQADIVADDLVYFGAAEAPGGKTLLQPLGLRAAMTVEVATFLRANAGDPTVPGLGYLKPLIARRALGPRRYDTALRIGEDYDLILRLLLDGTRYVLLADPLYAYRRHPGSISHRLSVERMAAMLDAHRALPPMPSDAARQAAAAVDRHLRRALRYEELVRDIKARAIGRVLPRLADPAMLRRLAESLRDRRRRSQARQGAAATSPDCPDLPGAGMDWANPPAPGAAAVAAAASRGDATPDGLPEWAQWLDGAVRGAP